MEFTQEELEQAEQQTIFRIDGLTGRNVAADLLTATTDVAVDTRAQLNKGRELLQQFRDHLGDTPCRLDHHGYCQEHWLDNPCITIELDAFLEATK